MKLQEANIISSLRCFSRTFAAWHWISLPDKKHSPHTSIGIPEGFNHFVSSIVAPVASGWSGLPGGILTHWKAPPYHGARQYRTFA
jgi:hypothetical protein